jgi:cyclopropane-fatty-acyl-phospholipid synthase
MFTLLRRTLELIVTTGDLEVVDPKGGSWRFGDGSGTPVAFRVADTLTCAKIALHPDLYLGECYMDGSMVLEKGTIYDLLALLLANMEGRRKLPARLSWLWAVRQHIRRIEQHNPVGRAQRNVAHHYDLSGELYDLFLDRDRQYSCAYFETATQSLDEAQLAKKRHLAAKLDIRPGMKVLDIGSGWGGLGLYLAEICGAEVTGVTLSEEQHKLSNQRATQRGVADRVKFALLDYRLVEGTFDRIVSVGMFEHVGVGYYGQFFHKVASLLKPDGAAVLHSIGRADGPNVTSSWIARYIFPGGYIPALSEVLPSVEASGLYVTDIEILRLHYAATINEWAKRFKDHRETAANLYDERFCRMWEFYLAGSEASFRHQGLNNFQIQFTRNQHALPLTREYMHAEEARLRRLDTKRPRFKSIPAE